VHIFSRLTRPLPYIPCSLVLAYINIVCRYYAGGFYINNVQVYDEPSPSRAFDTMHCLS
jgi:hypothetical protein